MFRKEDDFKAFQRVMVEAHERQPIRILSYCVLSNHWHFVVWPEQDGQLTDFFRWLAHTHAMRWRVSRRTVGYGPLYQGRFKSFPVQCDDHLLSLLRMSSEILCRRGSSSGRSFALEQSVVEGARRQGGQGVAIALAGAADGELDGSRQLSSNREGIRPSAGEPRQRTTLRRGRLGDANCKPTGLAAHGSSGRPAPQSGSRYGRDDKPVPGAWWRCQTQEDLKPPRSPPREAVTSCVLVSIAGGNELRPGFRPDGLSNGCLIATTDGSTAWAVLRTSSSSRGRSPAARWTVATV